MILVDTSVWVDHLRMGDAVLVKLLERNDVLVHPWVTGELALGNLRNREEILHLLDTMPKAPVIDHDEVLYLITGERLCGSGCPDGHVLGIGDVGTTRTPCTLAIHSQATAPLPLHRLRVMHGGVVSFFPMWTAVVSVWSSAASPTFSTASSQTHAAGPISPHISKHSRACRM